MNHWPMSHFSIGIIGRLFGLLCALGMPGLSLAQEPLQISNQVFQEIEVTGKNGKKEKKTVPAAKVVPGNEVIYVITYKNTGAQPAAKVVLTNPVPRELSYQGGSASGTNAKFEVSVDGGGNYGALPSLKVPDADGKPRPAQPADVTHLRWTLASAVPAGKEGAVSYKAVLK